ncbi:adenosine deaminase, partial [Francisella tularensis subsp. holarctica]|nr:adenosine deaminase [Francisella tularensis subsp. holarctica]
MGLDVYEFVNPPSKFKKLFDIAKKEELDLTTHVSEPGESIWEALDVLGVIGIDQG